MNTYKILKNKHEHNFLIDLNILIQKKKKCVSILTIHDNDNKGQKDKQERNQQHNQYYLIIKNQNRFL